MSAPARSRATGILKDNDIKVGHPCPRGGAVNLRGRYALARNRRRVARARRRSASSTNDLTRPAVEIAALYKERWQIELLFKWLKQNLKIRRFLGRSENAVKIQIYCALIAFLLIRMLRHAVARCLEAQPKALITRLKVAPHSRLDLSGRHKPPPRQPASLPPGPQLSLRLR